METLVAFCRKTGRRISKTINRMVAALTENGQLRIAISISIPLIAKFEVSYLITIRKNTEKPE